MLGDQECNIFSYLLRMLKEFAQELHGSSTIFNLTKDRVSVIELKNTTTLSEFIGVGFVLTDLRELHVN